MRANLLLLVLVGCGEPTWPARPDPTGPELAVVKLALIDAAPAPRLELPLHAPLEGLMAVDGRVWGFGGATLAELGDAGGLLPVAPVEGSASLGTIRAVSPRGEGAWLIAEGGLFHSAGARRVLESPLSAAFGPGLSGISAVLDARGEVAWLTTPGGAVWVADGAAQPLSLADARRPFTPEHVLAIDRARALVTFGDRLYELDLGGPTLRQLASGLGSFRASARTPAGALLVATGLELLERSASGALTRYVLERDGAAAPIEALAVTPAGEVLLAAAGLVGRWRGATLEVLARGGAEVKPHGLALDAAGDTFVLDAAGLHRLATARPVSFARDVAPFFTAHCAGCHAAGAQGAPVIDYLDLAVARARAAITLARLKGAGASPMPPANTEVLSGSQYAVVVAWVDSGMLP